jgi:hypothetical protein
MLLQHRIGGLLMDAPEGNVRDPVQQARRTRRAFGIFVGSFVLFVIVVIFNHTLGRPFLITNWSAALAVLAQYGTLLVAAIAALAFVVNALGTASTVALGWRADQRQAQEFKLKIEQLEMQLAEARAKNVSAQTNIRPVDC